MINILGRNKQEILIDFDRENQIPIIRSSICTGEQVAGFRDKITGQFHEVMLIRNGKDMDRFMEMYHLEVVNIKKEY